MIKQLNNYFYFSQKERRGISVLIILIFLVLVFNLFFLPRLKPPSNLNSIKLISLADSISENNQADSIQKIEYFKFDPNTIEKSKWISLGLSPTQAQTVINYRNAGGKFYRKEDLKKIYSISDSVYKKLEPYIVIPKKTYSKKTAKYQKLSIEINTADSADLVQVYGIGAILSKRIIKYRDALGGFYSINQLLDVYGIDSSKFESIKQNFAPCNCLKIVQININTATFKELLKHPYISYDFVKIIVNKRRKKEFSSLEDFAKRTEISDADFQKLNPYLKLE